MCAVASRRRLPDAGKAPVRDDGESIVRTKKNRIRTAIGLAMAAVVIGGGIAVADSPTAADVITGCYDRSGGNLRVIDAADRCKSSETRIQWNEQGPVGAAGPSGPSGPAGQAGAQGDKGDTGDTGPAGPAGTNGEPGPQGEQGVAGPSGPTGPHGEQGPAGTQGEQGPAGPQGEQGPQGPSGADLGSVYALEGLGCVRPDSTQDAFVHVVMGSGGGIQLSCLVDGGFRLSVHLAGTGTGRVERPEFGILCGTYCERVLQEGQPVELYARPAQGSVFAGWSGACTGMSSCRVTMDRDQDVTATFNRV